MRKPKVVMVDYVDLLGKVPSMIDMAKIAEKLNAVSAKHDFTIILPSNRDEYLEYCRQDLEHQELFLAELDKIKAAHDCK